MGLLIGLKAVQQLCKSGTNRAEINIELFQLVVSKARAKQTHTWGRGAGGEELSDSVSEVAQQPMFPVLCSGYVHLQSSRARFKRRSGKVLSAQQSSAGWQTG